MYSQCTATTHQVAFLVTFIVTNCVFDVSAQAATKIPFVIFQPGEFFDPFTEKAPRDHQPSASVTLQPNVLFSETNTAFTQPFWNLPTHTAYPRTIAQTSGSAAQVDAQIRKPSAPYISRPRTSNNQLKTPRVRNGYPRTIAQTSGNAAAVDAQIRQPSNAFSHPSTFPVKKPINSEQHLKTVDDNLKTLRRLTAQTKRDYPQPGASKTRDSQSSFIRDDGANPHYLVAEASGQTNRLVDQSSEFVEHPANHAASKSHGGGRAHDSGHHVSHSDKDVEDYKSNHHNDEKDFKKHDDHHKKSLHGEKGGHHNEHHDEAGHYKKHHEGKKSHKAAKFGEKKGHKRGHKTKGYHNKFHRDEYHREHRFYDDYHKEGHHEKKGDSHSHYKKKQGGHKNGGGHKSGHNSKKHGKKGYSDKGNVVDEHKGFNKEGANKKYQKHHKDYHKKRGNTKGNKYGYAKKH